MFSTVVPSLGPSSLPFWYSQVKTIRTVGDVTVSSRYVTREMEVVGPAGTVCTMLPAPGDTLRR